MVVTSMNMDILFGERLKPQNITSFDQKRSDMRNGRLTDPTVNLCLYWQQFLILMR